MGDQTDNMTIKPALSVPTGDGSFRQATEIEQVKVDIASAMFGDTAIKLDIHPSLYVSAMLRHITVIASSTGTNEEALACVASVKNELDALVAQAIEKGMPEAINAELTKDGDDNIMAGHYLQTAEKHESETEAQSGPTEQDRLNAAH